MSPDPVLVLRDELTAAAARRPRRRRRLPGPRLLAVAAALCLAGGGAWAAVELTGNGSPVPYPRGVPAKPKAEFGLPIASSVQIIGEQSDPAGGPKWAARVFHTTRGYGCIQVGRVDGDQIGQLGIDGAFNNDHLFHELRPGVITDKAGCVLLDAHNHAFLSVYNLDLTASAATPARCFPSDSPLYRFGVKHAHSIGGSILRPCPTPDIRSLDYGFAGPDAVSILYRSPTGPQRLTPQGPDGAYLIVLPRQRGATDPQLRTIAAGHFVAGRVEFSIARTASSNIITSIRYRDGSVCQPHLTFNGFDGSCPTHGPANPRVALPPTAAVRTKLHARITGPHRHLVLRTWFVARYPVRNAHSSYVLQIYLPGAHTHHGPQSCRSIYGYDIPRNAAVGQTVHKVLRLPTDCLGKYRIVLAYQVARHSFPGPWGPRRIAGSARAEARG
jgi:hypothetical protein